MTAHDDRPSPRRPASGAELPGDWFGDPALTEATPLTVTVRGRVFGHALRWDSPRGPVARGADWTVFHHRVMDLPMPGGTRLVGVGPLVLAAPDGTRRLAAWITAGEDGHGVWVNGAAAEGVSMPSVYALSRSHVLLTLDRPAGHDRYVVMGAMAAPLARPPAPRASLNLGIRLEDDAGTWPGCGVIVLDAHSPAVDPVRWVGWIAGDGLRCPQCDVHSVTLLRGPQLGLVDDAHECAEIAWCRRHGRLDVRGYDPDDQERADHLRPC